MSVSVSECVTVCVSVFVCARVNVNFFEWLNVISPGRENTQRLRNAGAWSYDHSEQMATR